MTTNKIPVYYWHVHHMQLFEPEQEPIAQRIAFIKKHKPKDEIETRLRLLKIVKAQSLLHRLYKYKRDYEAAEQAVYKNYEHDGGITNAEDLLKRQQLAKVREDFEQAERRNRPRIEALHRRECTNCPWDGGTIFPDQKVRY